ncbi:MAG TPA: prolyl oligopeptidase family serine peptidase [Rhizomicrobium sp.]
MRRSTILLSTVLVFGMAHAADTQYVPPAAPVRPVIDTYFGTKVTDPYRWMENRSAPEFVRYILAQGAYARHVIDRIPGRDRLEARVAAHTGAGITVRQAQFTGPHLFFMRRSPSDNTYKLYVRDSAAGPERLLVDPDHFASAGHHSSIDWYVPSQHGEKIAVGISSGGSEHSVIHVLQVATGNEQAETIDRAENGGVSWLPDASGFFYNRMQATKPGDPETARYLNSRAFLHHLGSDPEKDVPLIGTNVPGTPLVRPPDVPSIYVQPGTDIAFAIVLHGSEQAMEVLAAPLGEAQHPGAHWHKFADSPDGVQNVALRGKTIYLLTHKDAPRYKVVAMDIATLDWATARTIVPESTRVIQDIEPARDGLYIHDLDGGLGRVRFLDYASNTLTDIALPERGTLSGPVTDPLQPGAVVGVQGWLQPQQWFTIHDGRPAPLALAPAWKDDLSAFASEEISIRARDGVMVPLSILHRRDLAHDGKAPLWLTAYGSYGIPFPPRFVSSMIPFLEDGGVYAVCHVRGGGELGEEWHLAGMKATKPNTFHDLIDCDEYLHAHGYGAPQTTAIEGGSAGGITVGMAMVERPDLFRLVISEVGDSNALRAEFETDGDGNALEYGSVKTEAGFKGLAAMDAFSRVKDGVAYPAVLFTTGLNDPHVAPWQPGKMAARLQKATSSGRPVVILVDSDAGHGTSLVKHQKDREIADQMAFFYWQIGKRGYQPVN